jgi:hypothetical protein
MKSRLQAGCISYTSPGKREWLSRRAIMVGTKTIEELSKKYSSSPDEFIRHGSTLAIQEKKRNFQIERLEILARYEAATVEELENRIREGTVPEHPAWEDLIEIKNIEAEIREINNDIRMLQQA